MPVASIAPTAQLENEVLRLSRERAWISTENQLLNEIMDGSAAEGAVRLLRRLVPRPADGLALLSDVCESVPITISARGTALPVEFASAAIGQSLERLNSESVVLHISEHAPQNAFELLLIPIKEGDTLVAVLATTALWPGGLRRTEQLDILKRLGLTIVRRFRHERELYQHQQELWLTREMLRLKLMTDRATEQPLETLGQFASGLCVAAGMDRAVLYLDSRRTNDEVKPVVEAGMALPPTVASKWRTHEDKLAVTSRSKLQPEWYDKQALSLIGINSLWGHALAWPLQSDGRQLGTLIVSRAGDEEVSHQNRHLLEWSAELLAQTLRRIYQDAAIRRQARHDGLTDLANRRTFDTLLAGEIDRVRLRLSEECSLLLADLDRFKSINDRYGHQAGDEVLRTTAQLLREQVGRMRVGERSLLARYGGEELAILLPGVGVSGAMRIAEEIRAAIEQKIIPVGDQQLGITTSIGVASCPHDGFTAENLVAAADAALYRAKSEGRNRVCRPIEAGS